VKITLRAVTPDDQPFEVTLFKATHRELFGSMVGLSEAAIHQLAAMQVRAQQLSFNGIPNAHFLLILVDEAPAGRYIYSEDDQIIFIIDIMVLPEYQNQGIGAHVIEPQIASAQKFGKTIVLDVEKQNIRARVFYERLGFELSDGETESRYRMKWSPK
jgi:ribosomal protein S18 acetylase RimI-like enzyme